MIQTIEVFIKYVHDLIYEYLPILFLPDLAQLLDVVLLDLLHLVCPHIESPPLLTRLNTVLEKLAKQNF